MVMNYCLCLALLSMPWVLSGIELPIITGPTFNTGPSSQDTVQSQGDVSATQFTSDHAAVLEDFKLPTIFEVINGTQIVENLTSAENDMAQLKSQNEASISVDNPSEAEVAALTATVNGYISAMEEIEKSIDDFEASVLEFEATRSVGQSEHSNEQNVLTEQDLAALSDLETTLSSISTSMEQMHTLKDNVASQLDAIFTSLDNVPVGVTVAEANQLAPSLDSLEQVLASQGSNFITLTEDLNQQCSKMDQQLEILAPTGNTGIVPEEEYLTIIAASQSSIKDSNSAVKGFDDKPGFIWESYSSCAVTLAVISEEPWWMAEFTGVYGISHIEIEAMVENVVSLFPLTVDGIVRINADGSFYQKSQCFHLNNAYIQHGEAFFQACDTVIVAKYIRLTRNFPGAKFALCEFKVKGFTQYPRYHMDATMSSTNAFSQTANFASDFLTDTCAVTSMGEIDSSPWFQIDMREEKSLKSITLTNINGQYSVFMTNMHVLLYSSAPNACGTAESDECALYDGNPAGPGEKLTIVCTFTTRGRDDEQVSSK